VSLGDTEINKAVFCNIHELFLKEFSLAKGAIGIIQLRPLTKIYTLKRSRQNGAAAGSISLLLIVPKGLKSL
jgi:hypothetical protein